MSKFPGRPSATWFWVLLPLVVMVHLTLAVLAVAEFAAMGWPLPTWFDTGAVTLVLATAAAGLAASAVVADAAAGAARAAKPGEVRCLGKHAAIVVLAVGVGARIEVAASADGC